MFEVNREPIIDLVSKVKNVGASKDDARSFIPGNRPSLSSIFPGTNGVATSVDVLRGLSAFWGYPLCCSAERVAQQPNECENLNPSIYYWGFLSQATAP